MQSPNEWLQSHGLVAITLAVLGIILTISVILVGGLYWSAAH
jgi:hypothetical protein